MRSHAQLMQREAENIAFLLGVRLTLPTREERDRCIDLAIAALDRALTRLEGLKRHHAKKPVPMSARLSAWEPKGAA